MSSLTTRTFELNVPENGDIRPQYELLRKMLDTKPGFTAAFTVHNSPYISFPDPNAMLADPEREGFSVTFTWPLAPGDTATPVGLAKLFVEFKDFINDSIRKGSLEQALLAHGTVTCTMTEYLAGVVIGQWLLSDALISSVSISEDGAPNEQSPPISMSIALEFNAILR